MVYAVLSGEEQGLYGGKLMARYAREHGWQVEADFNNDIIGNIHGIDGVVDNTHVRVFSEGTKSTETPKQAAYRRYFGGEVDSPSRNVARFMAALAERYLTNLHVMMIYRTDRFGRGGDQVPFLAAGYPAVRLTEPHENYHRQHQDVRVEHGIHYGDVLSGVDFPYLAQVTRLNAISDGRHGLGAGAAARREGQGRDAARHHAALEGLARRRRLPRVVARHHRAAMAAHSRRVGDVDHAVLKDIVIDNYLLRRQRGVEGRLCQPGGIPRRRRQLSHVGTWGRRPLSSCLTASVPVIPPLGAMGGRGAPRILRPGVLGIAPLQLLAHFRIGALPESGQVPGDLHRPARGREQVQHHRHPAAGHARGVGQAEQFLQLHRQHRRIGGCSPARWLRPLGTASDSGACASSCRRWPWSSIAARASDSSAGDSASSLRLPARYGPSQVSRVSSSATSDRSGRPELRHPAAQRVHAGTQATRGLAPRQRVQAALAHPRQQRGHGILGRTGTLRRSSTSASNRRSSKASTASRSPFQRTTRAVAKRSP